MLLQFSHYIFLQKVQGINSQLEDLQLSKIE